MEASAPPDAAKEIEFVKSLVARHFPVYDVKVSYDVVQFFCRVDEETLEDSFEQLREEMAVHEYIPMITYDKGEHVVVVAKKPPTRYKSVYVNLAMLIITFVAMMFAGIINWASYADLTWSQATSLDSILMGILVFTLPLIAILGVHELGHFFMARRRNVAASLPFFIPSIPPLGTFGAFISLRDPIPNRKSLLEIGVAGPLAGLAVALPIAIIGLMLTNADAKPIPDDIGEGDLVSVSFPMIYLWIEELIPIEGDYLLHPTVFAAWVGFLVTALNLLPAGQLDGGHIARALLGSNAKYASWATIAVLIGLSFFFMSWILFAILILFLGARHPPPLNDITKLDVRRKAVGVFAFVVLIIAFVPVPMSPVMVDASFSMSTMDDTNRTIVPGQNQYFEVEIENLGNTVNEVGLSGYNVPTGWEVTFGLPLQEETAYESSITLKLNKSTNRSVIVKVVSAISVPEGNESVTIEGVSQKDSEAVEKLVFNFTIDMPSLSFWVPDGIPTVSAGSSCNVTVQVNNTNPAAVNAVLAFSNVPVYTGAVFHLPEDNPTPYEELNVSIPADDILTFGVEIFFWASAEPGLKTVTISATIGSVPMGVIDVPVNVA